MAIARGTAMNRILSIDPSSTFTGWAIFQDEKLVAWGKIKTDDLPTAVRFVRIVDELTRIGKEHGITQIAVEDVSYAWNSKNRNRNIAGLQIVFRSIKEMAKFNGWGFQSYNPGKWKNVVVGNASANKEITENNIRFRFPALPQGLTDHEIDAIAIGVCHAAALNWGNYG